MNPSERTAHPSALQVDTLVEFLMTNPALAKGFSRTQSARDKTRTEWQQLSERLNSLGGSIKSWQQWVKYWRDKKSAVKKKAAARAAARRRTGGGVEYVVEMSTSEERILTLMGGEHFATGDIHLGIQPLHELPSHQVNSSDKVAVEMSQTNNQRDDSAIDGVALDVGNPPESEPGPSRALNRSQNETISLSLLDRSPQHSRPTLPQSPYQRSSNHAPGLSSEVELENVPLRKDALRGLGLPLEALSGSIGKIKLQVPVRQFRSAPWCIIIERVYVIIGPKNLDEWDDEKEKKADYEYKLSQIDDIEAKWRAQKEAALESGYYASSYSGWLSYGAGLATNIIENLQLKINDVHIRYEDSITIPNSRFACGITIESLSAQSCDSNWSPGFTAAWSQCAASFKLVELKSFGFYWDRLTNDKMFGSTSSTDLASTMQAANFGRDHRYIIKPISAQAHFKRDLSETPLRTRTRPRLSCDVTVNEIHFNLSDFQYSQMAECIRGLDNISKYHRYRVLRPPEPVKSNPRQWWQYAARCHGFKYQTSEEKFQKAKENLHYIKICTKLVLNPSEHLSQVDKDLKAEVEMLRDFDELRVLREISLLHVPINLKLKGQDGTQGKGMLFQWFPQWWGWYGNNTSNSATPPVSPNETHSETSSIYSELPELDDQAMLEDEILNALEGSVDNTSLLKRDAVFGKFDFSLDSGQLNICSEKYSTADVVTMMELHFDNLKLNIETRPRSGSHLIGLSLGSVCVKDLITPNTEYPDLIKPQTKEDNWNYYRFQSQRLKKDIPSPEPSVAASEPWFQLQYERKPLQYNTDYRLVVKSKSLDVVYNMGALKWLIDFFSKPLQVLSARQKIEAMKYSTKLKLIKNWKSMLEGDLGQRKSWSLEIDVSAPQIILVENFSNKNTSIVLVDFGRFQLLKNAAQDRIRQHKFNDITTQSESVASKLSNGDSEEEDAFMTPCSTPPGSENSPSDSQTLCSTVENLQDVVINEETGLENAFHDKIYDKYTIDLTDLQVLVCKGREKWSFASTKGSSPLHVLDRFSISLQLERRVVHTADPEYPSLTLYGTLPKLIAHVNEHKIGAVCDILDIITADTYQTQSAIENATNILDAGEDDEAEKAASEEKIEEQSEVGQKDTSNLIVLQFAIDQMSLEVQSRGRSIAELQVTGVKAGLSKRSLETNITLSVHGLLLVDAIQSFGPDFELLVASHRHVGMDSVSGSLKQSEPCSPTSPGSPDPTQDKRPTSPQTLSKAISSLQRVNSATWSTLGDLDALITVEVHFVTPVDGSDRLQIANINFNNLDIIANQETIVELLGFLNRVFPGSKHMKVDPVAKTPDVEEKPVAKSELQNYPVKTEITFDFHRLNVLVLRALMRDSFLVGRKVGTFTMSEAKIHATLGPEVSVEGSLGGLQILDLTPEGVNHQRILSVGKDPLTEPPDLAQDLLSTLTQEIYGPNKDEVHQRQALSFSVSRNIEAVVSIKIRMGSVWYTHCARFMQELNWCATEFKHYLKNIAKSIRDKATDMAYGLVQPVEEGQELTLDTQSEKLKLHYSSKSPQKAKKKRRSKKVVINLDVVLDTPVLVVPRSSCSAQVIVAHLGKISVSNQPQPLIPKNENRQPSFEDRDIFTIDEEDGILPEGGNEFEMDDEQEFSRDYESKENNVQDKTPSQDTYAIDVRNMNLFSLDTSRRKGFRMSALPRAEDFYSCQQDAVAILHDTAIRIQVIRCLDDTKSFSVSGEHEENCLIIEGSVTQPLQISLSRKQYEQLLETADNIFKVPNDLVRPPTQVSVNQNTQNIDAVDSAPVDTYDFDERSLKDSRYASGALEEKKDLEVKVAFTLPIFIIQLKNEHDNPMIEISFREFSVHYEKSNLYETHIQVSLRSILMEDLLCPTDSKYRQMVISSPRDHKSERHGTGYSSASCPDLVRLQTACDIPTGSLPDNLESSAGFEKSVPQQNAANYNRSRLNVNKTLCPDTPPPSPQPRCTEDNLVIYSALLVDPECPSLATQYKGLKQISSIDFNCLDLIISVERWFLLLNFFGLFDEEDDRNKREGRETPAVREQTKGKTELEITVRSLNLVLVRNEGELAKVNISNAFFVVSKYDVSKIVEGRLGSVSLFDLTSYGGIYRERFLTSGAEALKFIYKRDSEKNNQRSLNKDAKLKIYTSSVRYVHTKRFIMEIHMFFKEFLQLQTPVMRKIKSTDTRYSIEQRPTQLGLEINAGSPIILLPLSFDSNQVIVADLGEFSLKNSFHLASEQDVITKKTGSSSLDEILDVMQIDLVNTNLVTGDRCLKSDDVSVIDQDNICLDMGSYWIMKKGESLLKEKCHLKLQIERNMDCWKSHCCPDVSVQGTLSTLEGVLDIEQYKLVRGFLVYNLGEPIDDIYNSNSFSLAESRVNLNIIETEKIPDELIWTNMSINLDLEDVSLVLNWLPGMVSSSASQSLACINFIKSCLKIDSFSDRSQDIDLVSQEILIMDYRFQNQASPKNVFTNILQPIRKQSGSNLVQAEIHSRKRNDHSKFTILLNNMRLMAIIDWIENIQDYLSQNAEICSATILRSHASEVSSMTNLSMEKTPIEVILNITDSELVLVEKTDQIDSNAVILKSTTVVSFKPSDIVKPIAINLNHLEVFSCILGYENDTALSIIDPITINVDVKDQNIEVQIQKQFCIRLSYHDVKMFTRMLQSLPKQTRTAQTSKEHKSNRGNEWYSSSVEKLCALGFKRSDCIRALEICGYHIDEAAIWLTKNTEPVKILTQENQNNPFEIHSIIIHALCISICVIDDCKDADVPLLELSLSQLEFKQELSKYLFSQSTMSVMGVTGFCSGHLKAIIASDYYNRNLSGWEPVIEPWECMSNWNYSLGQTGNECSRLNLHICSDKLLKFNITSTLIELWQLVRKNWTQDYYEGSNTSNGTGVVQSPSGFRRRTPFIPFALKNNTGENLWFKILLTLPGGITRTEVTTGEIISNWVKVEPNETLPFSFSQQNKLRHMDSHKLNLHQVLVHVEGWTQVGPVSVDRVGTFFRHAHREGTQFSAMPKARIVFAVTLEGSAQKLVTVRSALKVTNRLEDVILLKMDHPVNYLGIPDWPNAKTAIVAPSDTFSVPLSHVHASLFFKPLPSLINAMDEKNGNAPYTETNSTNGFNDNDFWSKYNSGRKSLTGGRYFQFCDHSIRWRECEGNDIRQEQRTCKGNREKDYNVVAAIRRDGYPQKEITSLPGHTIILMPPLRINNLLCCDLLYKISNHTQGRIQSSSTANIYEISLEEPINLSITLDGYRVSGQLSIPAGHVGTVEPKLRLMDVHNRDLQLRASIQSVKGNGMEISISAPFWLVNKTGLPLVFRQEGAAHAASGQFEEHEKARVVSPLMFSFSDPDASPALEVRLGNRYGTNPPWCQGINLHKDIMHRQLKTGITNETFVIGVEVRRGRGRYSRTSVVTFSPRFQLYNRSSHKLKFAQKCFVSKPANPEAKRTIIEAVPGCHFPFHWPRSDQDPLLCVKLSEVENCCWSHGIPINEGQSLYINIRNECGEMHFLRLEVILQGATYFLLFGDARKLPPPIRLDNYSEVPIKFFQYGCKPEWRTVVKPHSSVSYALDDPMGSQCLQIEAPGGDSYVYSLRDLNMSNMLTYSNFIYIAFKGTFQTPSISENLHLSSEFDIESQHLVLGVRENRVVLMRKCAGDRSQLWLMNSFEQLEHEGSSPPTEPGKKPNLTPRLVLDLKRAPNPMDYTSMVVRPANKQRQFTQTWKFSNGRLMCGHANMCVQARNGVFGLRPGSDAVLGRIDSGTHTRFNQSVPIEQLIERQKLRPGSGQLTVSIKMDGPIRTIQIKDVKCSNDVVLTPDPLWKHASHVISSSPRTQGIFGEQKGAFVDEYFVKVNLSKGVGVSVISKNPCEELAYISLDKIVLEAVATPCVRSVDLYVSDLQIDNQLLETPCPILMYTLKSGSSYDLHSPSALTFNAKMLPSPNANAVIFERVVLSLRPFVLYLEERLVLRAADFMGLGTSQHNAASLADESEFEAQQVATKILAANAKRYYFEDLQINPSQIRLSVITASKLSQQLSETKKKLGLTLIKFEDALIEFDRFADKHHFETLEVYLRAIKSHYKNQLKWHAASILGSVDFLGNPLGFANDLTEGVSGLIFEGSVKSLVKNVTHGISNSTAKLTETISDGLGRVVLNEQDNEARQKILEVPSGANTSGEHLAAGLKGFGFGLLGGVTSIVRHTYEGAQSDGLHGFISGLGKGIVGTVTKPLIGVLDLASETANAVRETSKSAHRVLPERKRLPRCVSGAPGGLLPPYSFTQAKGQQHLHLINKRNFAEQVMSYEPNLLDDRDSKLRLLVSTEYVRIFSRSDEETTIILSCHLSEVLSCHPVTVNKTLDNHKLKKSQYYIEISSSLPNLYKRPRVRCQSEEMAEKASRHINYAKSVYDEREHTLNYESSTDN